MNPRHYKVKQHKSKITLTLNNKIKMQKIKICYFFQITTYLNNRRFANYRGGQYFWIFC